MEKTTLVVVEVIDGWNLFSGLVIHETKALTVTIGSHNSKVDFNGISSSTNPIIIRLSWFIFHNPRMDWNTESLHFELVNETTTKYEVFPTSTLDFEHGFTRENTSKSNQHMQKFKRERYIRGNE